MSYLIDLALWQHVGNRRALHDAMPLFRAACRSADAAANGDRVAMAGAIGACRVAIKVFGALTDMRHGLWKRLSDERKGVASEANGHFWRLWLMRGDIERRVRATPSRVQRSKLPRVSRRSLGAYRLANDLAA